MKILQERFPKGTLPGQITDGRYIDEAYYENLKVLAEVITKDMTFMAIVSSSTLEVGTGKSVFVQQSGEAWIHLVNTIHGLNLPNLNMTNIVFKPKDIIKRAFEVPRYSVLIVDEWEDAHYWSELGITLRQFFRKCRKLNLFMICIIPDWFQLPKGYAISRSVFAIDVKFEGEFERGYFSFYNFERKKDLYINGKKMYNYKASAPNFSGRFTDGYAVGREEYLTRKQEDLEKADSEKTKVKDLKEESAVKDAVYLACEGQYPIKSATQMSKILQRDASNQRKFVKKVRESEDGSEQEFEDDTNEYD